MECATETIIQTIVQDVSSNKQYNDILDMAERYLSDAPRIPQGIHHERGSEGTARNEVTHSRNRQLKANKSRNEDIQKMLQMAEMIRDATQVGENTAVRVGTEIYDIVVES